MGVSHTHGVWAAALERCDLCMLSVVYLVPGIWYIMPEQCAHSLRGASGRKHRTFTDAYVQNKASRAEIKDFVLSTPAGKIPLSACHALQSVRVAPRPRPMGPAGLRMPEYSVFRRKVLVRREKLAKVRRFDKHTYTNVVTKLRHSSITGDHS